MENIFIKYSLAILFLPLVAFVVQIFFGKDSLGLIYEVLIYYYYLILKIKICF